MSNQIASVDKNGHVMMCASRAQEDPPIVGSACAGGRAQGVGQAELGRAAQDKIGRREAPDVGVLTGDRHAAQAGRAGCGHAVRGVFDRDAVASGQAESAQCEQVDGRIGLRRGDLVAARDDLELSRWPVRASSPRTQARGELLAIASRSPIAAAWSSQSAMPGSRPRSAFRPSRKATRRWWLACRS